MDTGHRVILAAAKGVFIHHSEVEPRMLLVHYLRETLDLTGTHVDMPFKTEKLWNIIHQK